MTSRPPCSSSFLADSVSLLQTSDGSITLYHHGWNAAYRSTSGARTESQYVFLEATGLSRHKPTWRVLELGFGGGMNFLVTALACLQQEAATVLEYWAVEREPLPPSLWVEEAYSSWVGVPTVLSLVQNVSALAQHTRNTWVHGEVNIEQTRLVLSMFPGEWQNAPCLGVPVHAVYHDPFGPKVNPDAWTEECFRWSGRQLSQDGRLATYSAAGAVRRAMAAAGLDWRKLPGPGKKREITVASPLALPLYVVPGDQN